VGHRDRVVELQALCDALFELFVGYLPLAECRTQGNDELDLLYAFFSRADDLLQQFLLGLFQVQRLQIANPIVFE
jgi:hypothetical protein